MQVPLHVEQGLISPGVANLFDFLNSLAHARYEGEALRGRIVLSERQHECVQMTVEFEKSVSLSDIQAARKVLEMTGPSNGLSALSADAKIYGLGSVTGYSGENEDLYVVEFNGPNAWTFCHAGDELMNVRHGNPRLPKTPFDVQLSDLRLTLESVFDNATIEQRKRLEEIARAASRQEHGTLVVFSEDAEKEAERLSTQGTLIEPIEPDEEAIEALTSIDGAILFDETGTCHAIGVILDGEAAPSRGTSKRGARYNSAIRYVATQRENSASCVAVVFSEDGPVDTFPKYENGPEREEITERIEKLESLYESPPPGAFNFRTSYYPLMNWLVEHEEYLTPEQAQHINTLQKKLNEVHRQVDDSPNRRTWPKLEGNPELKAHEISSS